MGFKIYSGVPVSFRAGLLFLLALTAWSPAKSRTPEIIQNEVTFASNGVLLSGTIYTPSDPHAAVVLVHGSDRTPRMADFAMLLAETGITVLTYDKRGVGCSGGVYAGPEVGTNNIDRGNLTLLAGDAEAAVKELCRHNPDLLTGLVGFSQAGWIIPLAARENPRVNFMVLFSGPVISTLEQLRFQFHTEDKPYYWDDHTLEQACEYVATAGDRYRFESTDPYDILRELTIPGLWMFGQKDLQFPAGLCVERLNSLVSAGKPYEHCLFPSLGHNLGPKVSTEPLRIAVEWIERLAAVYSE